MAAAEFNLFVYPSMGVVTCTHCGVKCSGGELHCNCADIIERHGIRGCNSCGCWYETFKSVATYYQELVDEGMSEYEAIEYTHSNYQSEWNNMMWAPCEKCTGSYRYDYECLEDAYKSWCSTVYAEYIADLHREDDYYDRMDRSDIAPWGGIR